LAIDGPSIMNLGLFSDPDEQETLAPGLLHLPGFANTPALRQEIDALLPVSPLRQMAVPSGGRMAVAMSNCGALGWVSDARGYRYQATDPITQKPWPKMPAAFAALARRAAAAAGFERHEPFEPDVCLINRYRVGTALGLHRDSDEANHAHPIVSVSIGASATFLWGGLKRSDPVRKLLLHDADVLVWGGPARLTYHGVAALRSDDKSAQRFNLTFRRAG
jgi:DNA oxidative demethylase